jgi:hypothetical protein
MIPTTDQLNDLRTNTPSYCDPVDGSNIDAALEFLERFHEDIKLAPEVDPTSHGGVMLRWVVGSKSLEFEFTGGCFSYHWWTSGVDYWDAEITNTLEEFTKAKVFQWLFVEVPVDSNHLRQI